MKKYTSKKLLVTAFSAAVCCVCGGIFSVNAIAQETNVPTNVFEMVDGASVRTVAPSGIRFITSVPKTVYESYTQPVCGTLIIPTDVLGTQELTLNTANVLNIQTKVWQQFGAEYDAYTYTGVLIGESVTDGETTTYTGLPSAYWNVSFSAVGYIYESGDTSNVTYTSTRARSLAQTAALALASGKETGDLTFLKEICDTVIGDGLSFTQTEVSAYAGNKTVDLSALLTGNQGLQAIWTSADETVATVDNNGVVTMLKAGEAKITATIGTKTAECTVKISDLRYDGDSQTVYWTAIDNAVSYKVVINRRYVSGTDAEYTTTELLQKVSLNAGINLITVTAYDAANDDISVRAITVEVTVPVEPQTFGQLKEGTDNEYYIAEWSNLAAWGQFSSAGYSGGPDGGVTFTAGKDVDLSNYDKTRVNEGYLHVSSKDGWGNGSIGLVLPGGKALTASEIKTINITLKMETSGLYPRFYFDTTASADYIDPNNNNAVTQTTADGWTTYSIDFITWNTFAHETVDKIYITSNTTYNLSVKEITYTLHGKELPQGTGVNMLSDFYSGVTLSGNPTVTDVATSDESVPVAQYGAIGGANVKKVTFNGTWSGNGITVTLKNPVTFNVTTHSLILQSAVTGFINDDYYYLEVAYNGNTASRQTNIQRDGIYSLNKNNYTSYGLTADENGNVTISSILIGVSRTDISMWMDCLYLIENRGETPAEGAVQIVNVADTSTYTLTASNSSVWNATVSTDRYGLSALVNTLKYSWNDAKQGNQFVNFATPLDMTDYDTIYVSVGTMKDLDFNAYVRQGTKFCGFTVTKGNGMNVYAISKASLVAAGLDITQIDGLSFSFKIGTFKIGGVWVK